MEFRRLLPAAIAAIALSPTLSAQTPALTPPPPSSQTPQRVDEEMLKELKAIRQLLEKLTTPPPARPPASATVTSLNGYVMGRRDAPLTMVEFTDLQCPYCRQYVTTTFEEIKKNWIDTGRLRYISRDFPLDFHQHAMAAARAARCAGEQGRFWEMRMTLMRNANLLSPEYIARTAGDLKLDTKAFAACSTSTKYDADIQSDIAEGTKIGVGGTPTFVVGRTGPDVVNGPLIGGALPYATFDARLRQLLGDAR